MLSKSTFVCSSSNEKTMKYIANASEPEMPLQSEEKENQAEENEERAKEEEQAEVTGRVAGKVPP